jgi:hypothetical protein
LDVALDKIASEISSLTHVLLGESDSRESDSRSVLQQIEEQERLLRSLERRQQAHSNSHATKAKIASLFVELRRLRGSTRAQSPPSRDESGKRKKKKRPSEKSARPTSSGTPSPASSSKSTDNILRLDDLYRRWQEKVTEFDSGFDDAVSALTNFNGEFSSAAASSIQEAAAELKEASAQPVQQNSDTEAAVQNNIHQNAAPSLRLEIVDTTTASICKNQSIVVRCPDGAQEGDCINIVAPNGMELEVVIPAGVSPSQNFVAVVVDDKSTSSLSPGASRVTFQVHENEPDGERDQGAAMGADALDAVERLEAEYSAMMSSISPDAFSPSVGTMSESEFDDDTGLDYLVVECPAGAVAGDFVLVMTPDGRDIEIMIPDGIVSGEEFEVFVGDREDAEDEDAAGSGDAMAGSSSAPELTEESPAGQGMAAPFLTTQAQARASRDSHEVEEDVEALREAAKDVAKRQEEAEAVALAQYLAREAAGPAGLEEEEIKAVVSVARREALMRLRRDIQTGSVTASDNHIDATGQEGRIQRSTPQTIANSEDHDNEVSHINTVTEMVADDSGTAPISADRWDADSSQDFTIAPMDSRNVHTPVDTAAASTAAQGAAMTQLQQEVTSERAQLMSSARSEAQAWLEVEKQRLRQQMDTVDATNVTMPAPALSPADSHTPSLTLVRNPAHETLHARHAEVTLRGSHTIAQQNLLAQHAESRQRVASLEMQLHNQEQLASIARVEAEGETKVAALQAEHDAMMRVQQHRHAAELLTHTSSASSAVAEVHDRQQAVLVAETEELRRQHDRDVVALRESQEAVHAKLLAEHAESVQRAVSLEMQLDNQEQLASIARVEAEGETKVAALQAEHNAMMRVQRDGHAAELERTLSSAVEARERQQATEARQVAEMQQQCEHEMTAQRAEHALALDAISTSESEFYTEKEHMELSLRLASATQEHDRQQSQWLREIEELRTSTSAQANVSQDRAQLAELAASQLELRNHEQTATISHIKLETEARMLGLKDEHDATIRVQQHRHASELTRALSLAADENGRQQVVLVAETEELRRQHDRDVAALRESQEAVHAELLAEHAESVQLAMSLEMQLHNQEQLASTSRVEAEGEMKVVALAAKHGAIVHAQNELHTAQLMEQLSLSVEQCQQQQSTASRDIQSANERHEIEVSALLQTQQAALQSLQAGHDAMMRAQEDRHAAELLAHTFRLAEEEQKAELEAARIATEEEAARLAEEEHKAQLERAALATPSRPTRHEAVHAKLLSDHADSEQRAWRLQAELHNQEQTITLSRVAAENEASVSEIKVAALQAAHDAITRAQHNQHALELLASKTAAVEVHERLQAVLAAETEELRRQHDRDVAALRESQEAVHAKLLVERTESQQRTATLEAKLHNQEQLASTARAELEAARIATQEEAVRLAEEEQKAELEAARIAAEEAATKLAAEEKETARLAAAREAEERLAAEVAAEAAAEKEEVTRLEAEKIEAREATAAKRAAEEEASRIAAEEAECARMVAAEADAARAAAVLAAETEELRRQHEHDVAALRESQEAVHAELLAERAESVQRTATLEMQLHNQEQLASTARAELEAARIATEEEAARLAEEEQKAELEAARIAAEEAAAKLAAEEKETARLAAAREAEERLAAEVAAEAAAEKEEVARLEAEKTEAREATAAKRAAEEEASRIAAEEAECARMVAAEADAARAAEEEQKAELEAARIATEEEAVREFERGHLQSALDTNELHIAQVRQAEDIRLASQKEPKIRVVSSARQYEVDMGERARARAQHQIDVDSQRAVVNSHTELASQHEAQLRDAQLRAAEIGHAMMGIIGGRTRSESVRSSRGGAAQNAPAKRGWGRSVSQELLATMSMHDLQQRRREEVAKMLTAVHGGRAVRDERVGRGSVVGGRSPGSVVGARGSVVGGRSPGSVYAASTGSPTDFGLGRSSSSPSARVNVRIGTSSSPPTTKVVDDGGKPVAQNEAQRKAAELGLRMMSVLKK